MREVWIGIAAVLLSSAGCAFGAGDETARIDPACERRCDAAHDVCHTNCDAPIGTDLCGQECIAKLDNCKKECR